MKFSLFTSSKCNNIFLTSYVFRCKWEGNLCHPKNLTKEVTDYGVCYTFNSGDNPLPTEKTGSRFGLGLTLNIEQYEYMRGPQSDAGVKVTVQ